MEIKVSDAEKIALERGYNMVIIIGINEDKSGYITTFGMNQRYRNIAEHIGRKKIKPFLFRKRGILDKFRYDKDIKKDEI